MFSCFTSKYDWHERTTDILWTPGHPVLVDAKFIQMWHRNPKQVYYIWNLMKEMFCALGESNDEGDLHQRGYVNFAYNHDINICLFDSWSGILKGKVNCIDGPQLCYRPKSASSSTAQFAVCYNNLKHIPDFTGHVVTVSSGAKSSSSARPRWVDESGKPHIQEKLS